MCETFSLSKTESGSEVRVATNRPVADSGPVTANITN